MDNPEELEATPQGATGEADSEHEQATVSTPPLSPREEAIQRIVEQNAQELEHESESHELSEPSDLSEGSPEALDIKVDGIEQSIPIDEAKAIIQKNMAADKRLQEAALKQRQLSEWEQQLQEREQSVQQSQQLPDQGAITDELKDKAQEVVNRLYDGDTDDAVSALTEILASGRTTATPDPEQLSSKAAEKALQAMQQREFDAEVETSRQQFKQDFADIADDPYLYDMADKHTITIMQQHPNWKPTQVINEAGRLTREWVNTIRGNGAGQPASRSQRKEQLVGMPRSQGSQSYQPPPKDNYPKSPEEVIAEMRAARGQAV